MSDVEPFVDGDLASQFVHLLEHQGAPVVKLVRWLDGDEFVVQLHSGHAYRITVTDFFPPRGGG